MHRFAMKNHKWISFGMVLWASNAAVVAEVKVTTEHRTESPAFQFKSVPAPANNDAATNAKFRIVDGEQDRNGANPAVLYDGLVPAEDDQPAASFFFSAGTDGGRFAVDLGRAVSLKQINTYSWHGGARGPQVYKVYAATGEDSEFQSSPKRGTDLMKSGWTLLAAVDTRLKEGDGGGQHGVSIAKADASPLGRYQHLLFDVFRTETRDAFGNTFFSEIDAIAADGPAPTSAVADGGKPITRSFEADGGRYQFTLDATLAPDLMNWADEKLRPVVQEWYPKLVAMLPSDGFQAPTNVTLRFRTDMGGTPASAGGGRVNMNAGWFRRELQREARGSVVHELVHVVQSYGRSRRTNPNATRTPGWIVEGIPDYIRWFLYEPETKGAEITERNLARAKYDASYRVSGNFLNWVTLKYDKELVRKLNAAAREGRYSEQLWKDWTGKSVQDLGEEWKQAHEERLSAAKPKATP